MNIYGLDFTSAPGRRKPITCAACVLTQNARKGHPCLALHACLKFDSFAEFEEFLRHDGPWLAALDFPFGQPRSLIERLGWPETWEGYVQTVAAMGKSAFEESLMRFCAGQAPGSKHLLRATDVCARSRSPMMLQRVPVAKMFFQGAPRLLASGASILPCYPTGDARQVVEGYPALVARRLIGSRSYKSDERAGQTGDRVNARREIVKGLRSPVLLDPHDTSGGYYGCTLDLAQVMADALIEDPMADGLDALLCAVQAAWAYGQRANGYGIPVGCDRLEGWIVDPACR